MAEQQTAGAKTAPEQSFPRGGLVDKGRATYQTTPLSVTQIRPGIFAFAGAGGTVTAIKGLKGCAVVDTGYGPRVDEIRRAITSTLQQSPQWLIDTHWHFDHTDGNAKFQEGGTPIVAHTNCRIRMSHDQYVPSLEWRIPASPRAAWPTVTFDSPVAIDIGAETLQLLPQKPAHTDADVAVWLRSANVLILGDLLVNGGYPIIDESSRGSLRGLIEASERFLALVNDETAIVPGHGPIGNRKMLLEFHDTLCTIEGRIMPLVAAHASVSEIIAAAPTRDFDAVLGRGYVTGDFFVRMVLAGLGLTEKSDADHNLKT
jgi:cyclase